jgi:hypothetical protein
MAKGDAFLFQETQLRMGDGELILSTDTLKAVILNNDNPPAPDDVTPTYSDYSADEVSAAGNYITGGITLTTVTWLMASGIAVLSADDVAVLEHASGFLDGYWCLIVDTTATGSPALGAIDMGGPESEQAGDVTVEFAGGVVFGFPANVLTWETP